MSSFSSAREAAARLFFRNFFALLLVVASAALWAVPLWTGVLLTGASPVWWMHVVAVAALYGLNRRIVSGRWHAAAPFIRVYTAFAFICLFCAAFLLLSSVVAGTAQGFAALVSLRFPAGAVRLERSVAAAYAWGAPLGMVSIASLLVFGYTLGQRQLRVVRVPLALRGMRRPFRIAQISDVHVGQNLSRRQLRRFVAMVNAQEADLVCITGDIADGPRAQLEDFFSILGELRAASGVWAVFGNHDHYAGADKVAAALRRAGIRLLRDEACTVELDGQRLHLIGLDDRGRDWARGVLVDPVLERLASAAPRGTPLLLLSHRPDIFPHAADCGVGLTLSGHTHGGQVALPWKGRRRNLAEFMTNFSRGLFERDGAYLYVNCGLGVTGQRIRLFTPREISVFEIASEHGSVTAPARPARAGAAARRFAKMAPGSA